MLLRQETPAEGTHAGLKKGATEDTPNKQDRNKTSARKVPSVKKVSLNLSADRHKTVTDQRSNLIGSAYLALLILALYRPVTNHRFVNHDANRYVTQIPHVQTGLTPKDIGWTFP